LKKITNRLKNPERRFKEMIINNKTNTIYLAEFNEFCYIIVILAKNKNLELAKLNIDIGKKIFEKEINNIN
jgi:predicted regulator of Ras-like GTPase activity (Roadblock/LC7/MglB family)